MIAFVRNESVEWKWERLKQVAALAGHSFVCASEFETSTIRPSEHDAAPDMHRFESDMPTGIVTPLEGRHR